MNRKTLFAALVGLALIGATAGLLQQVKSHRHLGAPGVKTRPLAGAKSPLNLEVLLPDKVPGWTAEAVPQAQIVLDDLPKDTSFGLRRYSQPDGFWSMVNVVLMGTDRTSIHKPEICMNAQGWQNDAAATREEIVPIPKPIAYELPVMRMVGTMNTVDKEGQPVAVRGIYVYWFIDADRFTARHSARMWWMARDVVLTGVLDRWAYVSFFSVCAPGKEAAAFARMKELIAATVPQFQLVPSAK